jgi:hypothetical protein
VSGLLPTAATTRKITEIFLTGTEPKTFDEIEQYNADQTSDTLDNLRNSLGSTFDVPAPLDSGQPATDVTGTAAAPGTNPLLD